MLLTLPAASYQESFLAYQKLPPEGTPLLRQPVRGAFPQIQGEGSQERVGISKQGDETVGSVKE